MKATDVRAMTEDQLTDELLKLKKEQFNLRFQEATGQLEKTARVRQVRRDIARVKTIQAEKKSESIGRSRCQNAYSKAQSCQTKVKKQSSLRLNVLFCTHC